MRLIVRCVLLVLSFYIGLAESPAQTPWTWLNPLPLGNDLKAVCSPVTGTYIAVGNYGTIVRSTDGGVNWSILPSGTTIHFKAISFADANNGFVVGEYGTILRTTDGGASWELKHTDSTMTLNGVSCITGTTATVVGFPGVTLKTTNGGTTWTPQLTGPGSNLHAVSFAGTNTGFIAGTGDEEGVIYRTTNGGANWQRQVTPASVNDLYSIWFSDAVHGVAVGSLGAILHTTNAGINWNEQPSGTVSQLNAVHFADTSTGYVMGETTILRTTDGGASWVPQSLGLPEVFNGVWLNDPNNIVAVGNTGLFFRTTNGGTDWSVETNGHRSPWYSLSFTDSVKATLVGYTGHIARTTNGGATWNDQVSGTTEHLFDVSFVDNDTGVVVGDLATILRTTNGGEAWTNIVVEPPEGFFYRFFDISFLPSGLGFMVGNETMPIPPPGSPLIKSLVLRSTDAGATWATTADTGFKALKSISFVNPMVAVSVGDTGMLLRSTDGGESWVEGNSGLTSDLNAVLFSGSLGFMVGENGTVVRSTDGGASWDVLPSYTDKELHGLAYFDEANWVAVGDSGTIFWSIDGGDSWAKVTSGTQKHLYTISMKSPTRAIVAGEGGGVLDVALDGVITSVGEHHSRSVPQTFELAQNYPNPFNPMTTIAFTLSSPGYTTLIVYDLLGRTVATLVQREMPSGTHSIRFDANGLPSGLYFYRLVSGRIVATKKLVVLK